MPQPLHRIFFIPEVDFDSLRIYHEPCNVLVLQINRTIRENFSDQEWTSSFGLEFSRKQLQPRVEQKHQDPNRKFVLLNLLVVVLLHLFFVEGLNFIYLQVKFIKFI